MVLGSSLGPPGLLLAALHPAKGLAPLAALAPALPPQRLPAPQRARLRGLALTPAAAGGGCGGGEGSGAVVGLVVGQLDGRAVGEGVAGFARAPGPDGPPTGPLLLAQVRTRVSAVRLLCGYAGSVSVMCLLQLGW